MQEFFKKGLILRLLVEICNEIAAIWYLTGLILDRIDFYRKICVSAVSDINRLPDSRSVVNRILVVVHAVNLHEVLQRRHALYDSRGGLVVVVNDISDIKKSGNDNKVTINGQDNCKNDRHEILVNLIRLLLHDFV